MKQFYAYMYLRKDGTPYYVGKGCGKRAFQVPTHTIRPPRDRSLILIMPSRNEQEALTTEIELIHNWGRKDLGTGILRNLTDGGDGSSGYKHTQDAVARMSAKKKGQKQSSEHIANRAAAQRGLKRAPEVGKKIGEANRLRKLSLESRERISASLKKHFVNNPKLWTEESRKRNSESLKIYWQRKRSL